MEEKKYDIRKVVRQNGKSKYLVYHQGSSGLYNAISSADTLEEAEKIAQRLKDDQIISDELVKTI